MRLGWSSLAVFVSLALAGCPTDPCALEPAIAGDATDEVWKTLDDATDQAEAGGDAAAFEAPEGGAQLKAADGPATFAWSSPLKLALAPAADPTLHRARPSLLDALSGALIPSVHAHLAPVTSDAYLLNVTVPGQQCPVQAVTTELEATLDDAAWDVVKAGAGQSGFSAQIISAYLESGRITEGPFKSDLLKFEVE